MRWSGKPNESFRQGGGNQPYPNAILPPLPRGSPAYGFASRQPGSAAYRSQAASPGIDLDQIIGRTRPERIKTGLAGVGVLAIVITFLRLFRIREE